MSNDALREALEKRRGTLTRFIEAEAPYIPNEQKHLDHGTPERAYWHYGYLMCVLDVLAKME